MRLVDISELRKFERHDWKHDRFLPLAESPDPDVVGKFFTIWTSCSWWESCKSGNDEAGGVVHGLLQTLFSGIVIHSFSRHIPGYFPNCQVSIIPLASLVHPREVPEGEFKYGMLWLRVRFSGNAEHGDQALRQMERLFERDEARSQKLHDFRALGEDIRSHWNKQSQDRVKEFQQLRIELYSMFFSLLFGEGSYLHVDHGGRGYLVTPFDFPPGYVRDTARALEAEYGAGAKLVQEFIRLTQEAQHFDANRADPDRWWTTCKRPSWVFMILFSRLMGQGQWNYSLAYLEREFREPIDWSQPL